MAALTGTPVAITWAAGANPAGQSVTIPADCNRLAAFWGYFANTNGAGLASMTLAGAAPTQSFEVPIVSATFESAIGVAIWDNPPTGSQTLDPAWDASPSDGPTTIVAFVSNADTSGNSRDVDGANGTDTGPVTVTLTTVSGDLVIKYDLRFNAAVPALSAGWTAAQTETNRNSLSTRLSTIVATGATQVCNCENEDFSAIVAVSIANAAAADGTPYQPWLQRGPLIAQ